MYSYEIEKPFLFTDDGQRLFLKARDKAYELQKVSGAFTVQSVMNVLSGDSWKMLACIDRLVELGEFVYASKDGCTQDWILRKSWR